MYRAGPVARTGPAVAAVATRERSRADPDFGGSNRREEAAADFLKWDTAQPGAKLAAMSNKSKSQPQQQQQQQPQHYQQQQHQQQQQHHPHPPHVIKPVDHLPPRYQPPPQPSSGILKNHLHFANGATSTSSSAQAGNQGPSAALSHHQVGTQPRTQPPPPSSSQHHQQQQQQSQQPAQAQQQPQQQQPPSKDAQSKYSPRIEHRHHPQPGNALIAAASAAASKSQQQPQPSTYLQQPKLGQGPYLPPSSQYPAVSGGQSAPVRQRISDDEFLRLGPVEMLKFVRKTESDIARLAAEQNRQIQNLLNELRLLKEANQRLNDDNQELRDLCCFLDDDRQKGRKLAREWQRFGRYTVSVMRQEVSAYQNKLRQLDNKQQELIKDNLELKELCLYLDEERGGGQRDDGDGSSSSTNAEETAPPRPRHTSTFNDQTMQYVRSLEQRVKQLEEDKSVLQARAQGWEVLPSGEVWDNPASPNDNAHLGSRPEAVVRALQVLEVREQLEREEGHDGEKALVREMCNVVWRKLEEGPQARH
ncbi:PREDICTED: coiled-coil domain-containing protein 85C [Vollenhovia emeryi]|uniref:coiled-coil domain-containing protein 85C n=1 Tax=Vollenhovia emeryi TaxID=411798 RepID=UPI0005F44B66|nr:PREDICTED: coiled-coil domain-containing protein 85C [Vollenhovia emeryi]